ncbi:MAG: DUF1579 domain-containing protein [Phycisphaerae bacterium]|nr:DUF1579 domain-containing protein [Phycisphaerae bacterium]
MRTRMVLGGFLCAAVAVWLSGSVLAQSKEKSGGAHGQGHGEHAGHGHEGHDHGDPGQMSEEEMMKQWMALNAPDEHHQHLAAMEGVWKTESKWWMSPESEPSMSTGKSVKKMVLDGRYLREESEGEVGPGMSFQGLGFTSYDKAAGQFQATWMDSMSTSLIYATGTCDASGKKFEYHGAYMDPMMKKMKKFRNVLKVINNDKHVFEMYESMEGAPEFKTLEITYTRG